MFAPPEAAKLLELPSDRQVWTRVYELLNKMHLKELIIERLNDVCPGPCRVSARNRRTAVQNVSRNLSFLSRLCNCPRLKEHVLSLCSNAIYVPYDRLARRGGNSMMIGS